MNKIIVGINSRSNRAKKNFSTLPLEKYVYKRTKNLFSIPTIICHAYFQRSTKIFRHLHLNIKFKKFDIIHLFNTIHLGRTPWICTFGTCLPRVGNVNKLIKIKAIKLLTNNNCKKIIAQSQNCFNIQSLFLEGFKEFKKIIMRKMCVLYPTQKKMVKNYEEKNINDRNIIFTFVGADFFRKGGREILNAFQKLIKKGFPIKLIIVSSMKINDYATNSDIYDYLEAIKIINYHSKNIIHYFKISNEKVLEIFKKTHVALLPTYADAFGYTVLEAQACGCPVITTNIRALPELNNDQIGWVIKIPKDHYGNAIIRTKQEKMRTSKLIEKQLYQKIETIFKKPHLIKIKGNECLTKIETFHNPKIKARKIEEIYDNILN